MQDVENFLQKLEQQLDSWNAVASDLKDRISDLQQGQEQLSRRIDDLSPVTKEDITTLEASLSTLQQGQEQLKKEAYGGKDDPLPWFTPAQCWQRLKKKSVRGVYDSIKAGHYRSGKEVQKRGGRWMLCPDRIEARIEAEQTMRRVC